MRIRPENDPSIREIKLGMTSGWAVELMGAEEAEGAEFHAGGMSARSRWLSGSTPPELEFPEHMSASEKDASNVSFDSERSG